MRKNHSISAYLNINPPKIQPTAIKVSDSAVFVWEIQ